MSLALGRLRDIEIINLELILADLAQVERRQAKLAKDKAATDDEKSAIAKLVVAFDEGKAARQVSRTQRSCSTHYSLLTNC